MKYISRRASGAFELAEYEDYLDRDRAELSAIVQGTALLAVDRFVPTGPGSFHDARFEKLMIATEAREGGDGEPQRVRVELRLKGPFFDRHFELHYEDVRACSLLAPGPDEDLLMHEIRRDDALLTHEFHFDNGKSIVITCRELRFLEMLATDAGADESEQ